MSKGYWIGYGVFMCLFYRAVFRILWVTHKEFVKELRRGEEDEEA